MDPEKAEPAHSGLADLPRPHAEFVVEGHLEIVMNNGCPMFFVDDAHLSELVSHHFHAKRDQFGKRIVGRVQIVVSPIQE